ncbi:unnamed protein product [Rotaria sp. Silwood2]|nr:unnamed protein product [Rotaria sp. Silwood2]
MQSPSNSDDSSPLIDYSRRSSTARPHRHLSTHPHSLRQPNVNPHQHLLDRTEENCPKHLTGSKRTRYLKAGRKARQNLQLIQQLTPFHYPAFHSINPVFIHHLTPNSTLESIINHIQDVNIYVIDTESEPPTPFRSEPLPATLQIQAIHNQDQTTILLIEVQFLPHPSTYTFSLIQRLCYNIFSPQHHIVSWGEISQELLPFQQFTLFDLSQIRHPLNLQRYFTNEWNRTHPHISSCKTQQRQSYPDPHPQLDLICHIDSDDLDEDLFPDKVHEVNIRCTCPDTIHPYKNDNEQWSLQKAIQYTFNEALDKALTFNAWTCGLDPLLHSGHTTEEINTRAALTSYAVNDILAPTKLLFHLKHEIIIPHQSSNTVTSTSTIEDQQPQLPSYFVLADSHAKHIDPLINTEYCTITTVSISGLKWCDTDNSHLCAYSLLQSAEISSHLSNASAILLLIGMNSVRQFDASQVIQDVAHTITYLHQHYPNLKHKQTISILTTFPCFKPSFRFPSISSLSSNIDLYNEELNDLSKNLHYTVLDFHVAESHLASDQMHLHFNHRYIIYNSIIEHFKALSQYQSPPPRTHQRSRDALKRRNKIRHNALKHKQQQFYIKRNIDTHWKPKHIKQLFAQYNIKYARLSEVHKHVITIHFNNLKDRDHADEQLTTDIFNEEHFHQYSHIEQ